MKQLAIILCMAFPASASADDGRQALETVETHIKAAVEAADEYVRTEVQGIFASVEYKREITKEFAVGALPSLAVDSEFGEIHVAEGQDGQIVFRITVTGEGRNSETARKQAEAVEVKFEHADGRVSAKTVFKEQRCRNCGRKVAYNVTVPKGTELALTNKFGDIKVDNSGKPVAVKLEFGKFHANELTDAVLDIMHGGATVNKCGNVKLKSGFSKYKFGEIDVLSGTVSYDRLEIGELGEAEVKSDFSTVEVGRLKKSFDAPNFSYGSLTIDRVDESFSNVSVSAGFSRVKIAFTGRHNFKAALYSSFGSVKTGDVVFYEMSLRKKDVVVGTAGQVKDPPATVNISNEHGSIVF